MNLTFLRVLNLSEQNDVKKSWWLPPSPWFSNYHPHMRAYIWNLSWGGGNGTKPCVRFFSSIVTLYGRYSPTEDTSKLSFKTNRDEKYCLSSEIQCLNVEDHLKNLDFTWFYKDFNRNSHCNLHRDSMKNHDPQHWDTVSPSSENIFHHGLF